MNDKVVPLKEVCVESLEEAIKATALGADRLELCARLDLEGLSPSPELITEVLEAVDIPVRVMVRPRAGDFIYTNIEKEKCFEAIDRLKKTGVEGIVIGAINTIGELDIPFLMTCFERSKPLKMTIHKAIDVTPDPVEAVLELNKCGYKGSILSSGGAKTAKEGAKMLSKMLSAAAGSITIIPAGRITDKNFNSIHQQLKGSIYHGRQIVGDLNL